jgi:hypothetical protein
VTTDPWTEFWQGLGQPAGPLFLRPGEEPARVADPVRIGFEDVWPYAYDGSLSPFQGRVIPLELARPGDEQVVVHGRFNDPTAMPRPGVEIPVSLDELADLPSVSSVVASHAVVLRRTLPSVRELLLVSGQPPDNETLANLPNLEVLSLGRSAPGATRVDLRVLILKPLRDLRFRAWHVSTIEPLPAFRQLERLRIEETTSESIAPLGSASSLRWLAIGYWKGLPGLAGLTNLDRAELTEVTVSNLRSFRRWTGLRSLQVTGRRLRSLSGIEALTGLEDLFLYSTSVEDLMPIAGLSLRRLRIDLPPDGFTLNGVGALRGLRSVVFRLHGGSVPSLAPLAALERLEELAVMGQVVDRDLEPLFGLRGLKRLRLIGTFGAQETELRARLPATSIEVVHLGQPGATSPASAAIEVSTLAGSGEWSIFVDVARSLGVADNLAAEAKVRAAIASERPDLMDRLDFDSEPERLSIVGDAEADVRAAAEITARLIESTGPSSRAKQ